MTDLYNFIHQISYFLHSKILKENLLFIKYRIIVTFSLEDGESKDATREGKLCIYANRRNTLDKVSEEVVNKIKKDLRGEKEDFIFKVSIPAKSSLTVTYVEKFTCFVKEIKPSVKLLWSREMLQKEVAKKWLLRQ